MWASDVWNSGGPSRAMGKDEVDEPIGQVRPPSPPQHMTNQVRGIHAPSFSAFQPRELKIPSHNSFTHCAWNCDGHKLACVGIDKSVRVWNPEKNIDARSASQYISNGHEADVDYVAWNPKHPELFCSSSQRDLKVVFWDARQSRSIQTYVHKVGPTYLTYSPDGKTLCISGMNQLSFLELGTKPGETKETWSLAERDASKGKDQENGSAALFNHTGQGIIKSHLKYNSLVISEYPSLSLIEQPPAHVGGCTSIAYDPRGRYLASGGGDTIVNLFDTTEWICVNTITCCNHSISSLSFSHDGEYLAIGNDGPYIDVVATETTLPLHRVQMSGPVSAVAWHPSKLVFVYCGQTKHNPGTTQLAFLGLFGAL